VTPHDRPHHFRDAQRLKQMASDADACNPYCTANYGWAPEGCEAADG
jgi:hypothetical protein